MIYCHSKRRDTPVLFPSVRYSKEERRRVHRRQQYYRGPSARLYSTMHRVGRVGQRDGKVPAGDVAKSPNVKLTARSLIPRSRISSSRVSFGTFESSEPPFPAPTRSRGSYATFEPPSIAVPACATRPSRAPSPYAFGLGVVGEELVLVGLSSSGSTKPLLEVLDAATRRLWRPPCVLIVSGVGGKE